MDKAHEVLKQLPGGPVLLCGPLWAYGKTRVPPSGIHCVALVFVDFPPHTRIHTHTVFESLNNKNLRPYNILGHV